ncbi:hypothetical protein EYF80_000379 [Liparis tanakae]|uniref:Uncharacterized protein n=1 Tax=Liparis tanakae TaxID=230148 RepID=A0A4Z2JGJ2_9TELE|nr:hypothetical protein EYF80_000379 [Liparis tanakae]
MQLCTSSSKVHLEVVLWYSSRQRGGGKRCQAAGGARWGGNLVDPDVLDEPVQETLARASRGDQREDTQQVALPTAYSAVFHEECDSAAVRLKQQRARRAMT